MGSCAQLCAHLPSEPALVCSGVFSAGIRVLVFCCGCLSPAPFASWSLHVRGGAEKGQLPFILLLPEYHTLPVVLKVDTYSARPSLGPGSCPPMDITLLKTCYAVSVSVTCETVPPLQALLHLVLDERELSSAHHQCCPSGLECTLWSPAPGLESETHVGFDFHPWTGRPDPWSWAWWFSIIKSRVCESARSFTLSRLC